MDIIAQTTENNTDTVIRYYLITEQEPSALEPVRKLIPEPFMQVDHLVVLAAASEDDVLLGALAASDQGRMIRLLYIAVTREKRRRGIGSGLLDHFLSLLRGDRFALSVSSYFFNLPSLQPGLAFMQTHPSFIVESAGEYLSALPHVRRKSEPYRKLIMMGAKKDPRIRPCTSLSAADRNRLLTDLHMQQAFNTRSDAVPLQDLSFVKWENEHILAAAFFYRRIPNVIELEIRYQKNYQDIIDVCAKSFYHLERKYKNAVLAFLSMDEKTDDLFQKLFGEDSHHQTLISAHWNGL